MKPKGQAIIQKIGITIGIIGGLLGMAVGIAAAPVIGGIMSLFMIIIFGLAFGPIYLRSRKSRKLLAGGRRANGRIVEMWDTGVTLNKQPQIGLTIEVTPDGEPSFRAEVQIIISRLQTAEYRVGAECVVRYDPDDKKTAAIESIY